MTRASIQHQKHLTTVINNLGEQQLDRAHIITAFFWAGLASGWRMRYYADRATSEGKTAIGEDLVRHFNLERDDPFAAGWVMGWNLEYGKGE